MQTVSQLLKQTLKRLGFKSTMEEQRRIVPNAAVLKEELIQVSGNCNSPNFQYLTGPGEYMDQAPVEGQTQQTAPHLGKTLETKLY